MEIQAVPLETLQAFLVCLVRVAAMLLALPVFGSAQVPVKVRTALIVVFSLVLFPVVRPYVAGLSFTPFHVAVLALRESFVGLMMAFTARFIFSAIEMAGAVVGYQMGFAAANVFDPQNQSQTPLISQLQNVLAILVFLVFDVHHLMLRIAVESFRMLPPAKLDFSAEPISYFMELSAGIFVLGVKFSAPILAVLLLSGLVLGLMARVFPQMNVFMISFPVNIGLAFITMSLCLDMTVGLLDREFNSLSERLLNLFSLF